MSALHIPNLSSLELHEDVAIVHSHQYLTERTFCRFLLSTPASPDVEWLVMKAGP